MEQMKIGRFAYYVAGPAQRVFSKINAAADRLTRKITGKWYCDGCKVYHPGRVIGFYACRECDGVCSKHITPEEAQKCEAILLGGYFGRDVSEQVKQELLEGQK